MYRSFNTTNQIVSESHTEISIFQIFNIPHTCCTKIHGHSLIINKVIFSYKTFYQLFFLQAIKTVLLKVEHLSSLPFEGVHLKYALWELRFVLSIHARIQRGGPTPHPHPRQTQLSLGPPLTKFLDPHRLHIINIGFLTKSNKCGGSCLLLLITESVYMCLYNWSKLFVLFKRFTDCYLWKIIFVNILQEPLIYNI